MSKEAMKLALEALKNLEPENPYSLESKAINALEEALANHYEDNLDMVKQEQGEPVACDNCKKLEDELEPLRIKAELWKRDAIVWKSAYDVEVGFREQEQRSVRALADNEHTGEPVAWHVQEWSGTGKKFLTFDAPPETPSLRDEVVNPVWKPLVFADTTPQERKPLTDEQIDEVIKQHTGGFIGGMHFVHLARAIEAAHGIKE